MILPFILSYRAELKVLQLLFCLDGEAVGAAGRRAAGNGGRDGGRAQGWRPAAIGRIKAGERQDYKNS